MHFWDIFGGDNHMYFQLRLHLGIMDTFDWYLSWNRDWDPSYLTMLFSEDFNDCSDLWNSNVDDS